MIVSDTFQSEFCSLFLKGFPLPVVCSNDYFSLLFQNSCSAVTAIFLPLWTAHWRAQSSLRDVVFSQHVLVFVFCWSQISNRLGISLSQTSCTQCLSLTALLQIGFHFASHPCETCRTSGTSCQELETPSVSRQKAPEVVFTTENGSHTYTDFTLYLDWSNCGSIPF